MRLLFWRRRTVRREAEAVSRLGAVMAAVSRSEAWHIDQHRAWRRVAGVALAGQALTIAALVAWMGMRETVYVAVATDPAGRTLPIVSAEAAGADDEVGFMLTWTVAAVTEAFTMGFHDYRMRVEGVRKRFTDDGYDSYRRMLEQSLVFQRVGSQGQAVSAVARGAPVLLQVRHFENGGVGYEVAFPLLLTFWRGEDERVEEKLRAKALVMRLSRSERLDGIAVALLHLTREARR
ncbi:MAG: hypothetical protein F4X35_00650 [Alphaproteobacteria bacterium]|nr:hypothetical protein [Alphaproteobacteria bacterium]